MILRGLLKSFLILLASFLLIEAYYQLDYRAGSVLPAFVRLYDYNYIDAEGTPRVPTNLSAWHKSYAGRPDIKININSQGFRGNEPLPTPTERIIMLGDSMVFNGAVENEQTFPSLTEASLRRTFADSAIEILNFGMGDTNSRQYFLKLKNHALAYHPSLVLVFVYLNDAIETPLTSFNTSARSIAIPWYHSFAFENLSKAFRNFGLVFRSGYSGRFDWIEMFRSRRYLEEDAAWKKMLEDAKFDWGAAWNQEGWRIIETSLAKMVDVAQSQQTELWMVVLPVKPQLELSDSAFELKRPQQLGEDVARRLSLKYLDPLPFLRSLKEPDQLIYDQCHFTALGNKAIADYLVPHLEAWLKDKRSGSAGISP